MRKVIIVLIGLIAMQNFAFAKVKNKYLALSKEMLELIDEHYRSEEQPLLFNETYPFNPQNIASYTVSQDTISKKRVAYLWPTSGIFSGVVALLEQTGDKKYKRILNEKILPGLAMYFDTIRQPTCYQSYLTSKGSSDRFYDDNVWLVIDFTEAFRITKDKKHLKQAELTWKFVISGWDEKLNGGIYWCEQAKKSKNTCSNAPSVVAATKLYEVTKNKNYLDWAKKIYSWTKSNLQDSTDFLYFDNINLAGKIDRRKFAYNSGQMLQGACLLYKATGNTAYLNDAQNIAKSAIRFYSKDIERDGITYRVFHNNDPWFITVMLRGYFELYYIDKNQEYVNFIKSNMDYLMKYARYENGLFYKDWTGENKETYKWLLNQACIVELSAKLSGL